VAVTTSSAERGDRQRELGATHVLDRAGAGGEDAPAGYDVIFDVVAGAGMPSFFNRLNPNGRMVVVGVVAGYPPADFGMTMMAAFQKSLSFATFSSDTVPSPDRLVVRTEQFAAAGRGELKMVVHEVLPLWSKPRWLTRRWMPERCSAGSCSCPRDHAARCYGLPGLELLTEAEAAARGAGRTVWRIARGSARPSPGPLGTGGSSGPACGPALVRASSSAETPLASAAPVSWKISRACRRIASAPAAWPAARAQRPRPAHGLHPRSCRTRGPGPGLAGDSSRLPGGRHGLGAAPLPR
jgi:hypothetical protein